MRLWEEVIIPNEADYNKLKAESVCNSSNQPSILLLSVLIYNLLFK